MEWLRNSSQKIRVRKTGQRRRPHALLRLATTQWVPIHKPQRAAQVFWLWKDEPWSSGLPSSREGVRWCLPTNITHGQQSSHAWDCSQNTQTLLMVSDLVLIWASHTYLIHTFHPTIRPSYTFQMYIVPQSKMSSQLGATSAHSRAGSWRLRWAPFRHRPYPLFPKCPSPENIEPYTIFPSLTTPHQTRHPSTPTLTAKISHAHGGPLLLWCKSSHTYHRVHRHQYGMWQRCTEQSQPDPHSGPDWSSVYRRKTSTRSIPATTSALPQQEAFTEWWLPLGQTFFVATGSALWQNGWTITSSSESHVNA
jgi:hypothetical protein